ncbi:lectin-like domain-containing protein [Levilactobacillus fujinensis]
MPIISHAADEYDHQETDADWQHAVDTAPQGVPLDNLFHMAGAGSLAKIVDSPLVPRSIAQLTLDTSGDYKETQGTAIWSTKSAQANPYIRSDNRFDLKRDQAISLWMYFGNKGTNAADGMAFVLQNSEDGKYAEATGGEGLNVWGSDRNSIIGSSSAVAMTAIENSWALEFDTNVNKTVNSGGMADSFDAGPLQLNNTGDYSLDTGKASVVRDGMHIASGYPADAKTYMEHYYKNHYDPDSRSYRSGYFFTMNHTNPKAAGNLSNGEWHHLSLKWKAADKTMTYTFNDRDPKTNQVRSGMDIVSDTLDINTDKLGIGGGADGNVFWGITGSSGSLSENGLVVIDSSDSLGHVTSQASLIDVTQNKKISKGDSVAPGDKISYKYTFNYEGDSQQDIEPLTMDVPLPMPLQWQTGGVSYQKNPAKNENFNSNELNQERIKKAWVQPLDGSNPQAVVTVTGVAPEVKTTTSVAAVTSRFYGPNYQTKLTLPSYMIKAKRTLQLDSPTTTFNLRHSESATITGQLTNAGVPIPASEMQDYHVDAMLNGHAVSAGSLDKNGSFEFTISPKQLNVGSQNKLVLVGADQVSDAAANDRNHQSNSVTISLNRQIGTLYISKLPQNASFIPTELKGHSQWVSRQSGWNLDVVDERGAQNRWTLAVSLETPFHTVGGTTPMNGNVALLRNGYSELLTTSPATVMSKTTHEDDETTHVLQEHWDANNGFELQVNGGAIAGNYEGTFNWQLIDAPQTT